MPEQVAKLVEGSREGGLVIQRNSGTVYVSLAPELVAKGVIFTDLETAVKEHADLVKPYLHQALKNDEHAMVALHAAVWNGGVFLYVPKMWRLMFRFKPSC